MLIEENFKLPLVLLCLSSVDADCLSRERKNKIKCTHKIIILSKAIWQNRCQFIRKELVFNLKKPWTIPSETCQSWNKPTY